MITRTSPNYQRLYTSNQERAYLGVDRRSPDCTEIVVESVAITLWAR